MQSAHQPHGENAAPWVTAHLIPPQQMRITAPAAVFALPGRSSDGTRSTNDAYGRLRQ
jgi:hypothetical protein